MRAAWYDLQGPAAEVLHSAVKVSRNFPVIGVIPVAQHVETRLVDDLDGSEAAETVTFQVDFREYEIDLNEEHAARLRDALAPYVAAARRVGGSSTPRRQSAAPKRSRQDLAEVRAWLAEHGYPVKERGRIPARRTGWSGSASEHAAGLRGGRQCARVHDRQAVRPHTLTPLDVESATAAPKVSVARSVVGRASRSAGSASNQSSTAHS